MSSCGLQAAPKPKLGAKPIWLEYRVTPLLREAMIQKKLVFLDYINLEAAPCTKPVSADT